jgi:glutathione S-transferase
MSARLKVYQFAHSPFCIAVIQALRAGGIEPELVHVPNADRSELIRLTNGAYYQVPVLADGERLVYESGPDSQDVAAYIDEHYLGGRLFPAPTRGWQWIVNRYLEHEVEDVTFKVCDAFIIPAIPDVVERTLLIRHKERKFGPGCVERWGRERASLIAEAARLLAPFRANPGPGRPLPVWGGAGLQRLPAVRPVGEPDLPRCRPVSGGVAGPENLARPVEGLSLLTHPALSGPRWIGDHRPVKARFTRVG